MDIIICGAGEVGSHAAEILGGLGHRIRIIDRESSKLRAIEETMDVATLLGNCADAEMLRQAGCEEADLVLAATNNDEVNLLTATLAKGLGTRKTIARVHHSAFFEERGLNYRKHLNIDRLICPEYLTAQAIARTLRNPGAVAIEGFARGRIEMQEFTTGTKGSALGKRLMDVKLPAGTRLAMIKRQDEVMIPEAKTVVAPGDTIILVGNAGVFQDARKLFHGDKQARRKIVLMGGPAMTVWLCRSLRDRNFSIRVFEKDKVRAEELAEKLDWVTVISADPTERAVFEEEHLSQADVFISLLDHDEENIIAGVLAKTRGVSEVITIHNLSKYLDLVYDIGIDHAFSPKIVGVDEIRQVLDENPLRLLGTLVHGIVDVFRVKISKQSPATDKHLREIGLSPDWVVAAIQRGDDVHVPGADDVIMKNDILLVIGKHGKEDTLKKLLQ
ncbi:MAG: Trk system potassium transporter TrkA [Planctomycetota bacterium]|nr:Trk system potassium transporter TrkA [Planctomycetota bacterium]